MRKLIWKKKRLKGSKELRYKKHHKDMHWGRKKPQQAMYQGCKSQQKPYAKEGKGQKSYVREGKSQEKPYVGKGKAKKNRLEVAGEF